MIIFTASEWDSMHKRLTKFIEKYRGAPTVTDASPLAPDFEERVQAFKEYYSTNFARLRAAEKTVRNLLQLLVSKGEDPMKIDGFVNELKQMAPDLRLSELRDSINTYSEQVKKYRDDRLASNFNLNPFTEMRHILYLHNPNIFDRMLYPRQRDFFLEWLGSVDESDTEAAE
jgi:hypothetical protein